MKNLAKKFSEFVLRKTKILGKTIFGKKYFWEKKLGKENLGKKFFWEKTFFEKKSFCEIWEVQSLTLIL